MKRSIWLALFPVASMVFMIGSSVFAQDRVVVVPLGNKKSTGDVVAEYVLEGRTFSNSNGVGLKGTMADNGAGTSITPGAGNQTIASGYWSSATTVEGDTDLISENIISGAEIFGVTGTQEVPGKTVYSNSLGMDFAFIPAGSFYMGSPTTEIGRWAEEKLHGVILTAFYMQITEVTNGQWNSVIVDRIPSLGVNPSKNKGDMYPVETVNWYEAVYFANQLSLLEGLSKCYTLNSCSNDPGQDMECDSVDLHVSCTGYRLPTEAQWEYAARAGTVTAFYNGDITVTACGFDPNLDKIGWYCGNAGATTHLVGQKDPNSWGLYDMSGNVYEWVQDWHAAYPTAIEEDPSGPATGEKHVARGGAFNYTSIILRSAKRDTAEPGWSAPRLGFRLVLPSGQ